MAQFKGFDYKSPQEILAEVQQGFMAAQNSGNVDAQRFANARMAGAMLGQLPEVHKAQKTQGILKDAYKTANESFAGTEEVDDLERQIAYYREAQKAAIDAELPEIAMQATQSLSELTLTQEERQRLKAREAREVAEESRTQKAFELQHEVDKVSKRHLTQGMLVDPNSLEIIDRGDLTDPDAIARMDKLKEERPDLVYRTESEYIELTEAEKDRKARLANAGSGMGGRSQLYKKWYEKTQAMDTLAVTSSDFVDLLMLEDAQQVFASGGAAKGLVQRAGAHARSFLGMEGEEAVGEQFAKDARWNTLSEEKQALVLELGYSLATSREGGRLTDQDVDRAIRSLGVENPDPRAVAWIFGRSLKRSRDIYSRSKLTSGVEDLEAVNRAHAEVLAGLDEQIDRLESKYKLEYGENELEDSRIFDRIVAPVGSVTDPGRKPRITEVTPEGDNVKVRDYTLPGTS